MNNKEQNFISAVVYVHNCESILEGFLNKVINALEEHFLHSEIICVDDASTDGSAAVIRRFKTYGGDVSISMLSLNSFHGREAAMQGGVSLSVGDFVYEFDVPNEYITEDDIFNLYSRSVQGYDIVAAIGRKSRKSSSIFYNIINSSGHFTYDLCTEYCRIISRRAINRVGSLNKVVTYRKVAYATTGLKYSSITVDWDIPVRRIENPYRRRLAVNSLIMFTDFGFRFSLIMTVVMMVAMIAVAIYAVIARFAMRAFPGWTSTVLLLTFGFFGLFGILSIITKYLQLLMDINVKKTAFTFESVEKITRDGK